MDVVRAVVAVAVSPARMVPVTGVDGQPVVSLQHSADAGIVEDEVSRIRHTRHGCKQARRDIDKVVAGHHTGGSRLCEIAGGAADMRGISHGRDQFVLLAPDDRGRKVQVADYPAERRVGYECWN